MNIKDMKPAEVQAVEEALITLFRDTDIDTGEGSVVRELLLKPAALVYAWQQSQVRSFLKNIDLRAIAEGRLEGDDKLVDRLASTYRLTRRGQLASRGSIVIYLTSESTTYINKNYSFFVGDSELDVDRIYVGIEDPDKRTSTAEVKYTHIHRLGDEYYMLVPVSDREGRVYPTGTPVTFTGSTQNIDRIEVFSPITGGAGVEDNQSLASRVLYGLAPGVLSTPLQLRAAFQEHFGLSPDRVKVFGSGTTVLRRAVDSITHLPLAGYTDIVVFPEAGLSIDTVSVTASSLGLGRYYTSLNSFEAAGVYDIRSVEAYTKDVEGNGVVIDVKNLKVTWGTATTNERRRVGDGRYSSFQTATISFDTGEGGGGSSLDCVVTVRKVNHISDLQRFLDDDSNRALGQDIQVRSAVPGIVSLRVCVDRTDHSEEALTDTLVRGINRLPVGHGALTTHDIINMLPEGTTLSFPLHMKATFLLPDGAREVTSDKGALEIPGWEYEGGYISADETAYYTDKDNIRVVIKGGLNG